MSQVPIEQRLANKKSTQQTPIFLTNDCAGNIKCYKSEFCKNQTLYQATKSEYNSVANEANLKNLENRLQDARNSTSYLDERATFNQTMAQQLNQNGGSLSSVADCYNRRSMLLLGMPAAYHAFHSGCQNYDAARKAAETGVSSAQVANLVEKGLANAEKSISTVQSTLASAKEEVASAKEEVSKVK